jgi:hypothetical protein
MCAFPLYVLMVPSSVLSVAAYGERLSCGGFSLGETIRFGSLEFIADCFDGLSLSRGVGGGSYATFMGSNPSGSPSPLQAMIGNSTKEFPTASGKGGGSDLPTPRRHGEGALPAPTTTIAWLIDTLTTQAMTTIP